MPDETQGISARSLTKMLLNRVADDPSGVACVEEATDGQGQQDADTYVPPVFVRGRKNIAALRTAYLEMVKTQCIGSMLIGACKRADASEFSPSEELFSPEELSAIEEIEKREREIASANECAELRGIFEKIEGMTGDDRYGLFLLIERIGELFNEFSFDETLIYDAARLMRTSTIARNRLQIIFDSNFDNVLSQFMPGHESTIAEYHVFKAMLTDATLTLRSHLSVRSALNDFKKYGLVPPKGGNAPATPDGTPAGRGGATPPATSGGEKSMNSAGLLGGQVLISSAQFCTRHLAKPVI
jgi:hypothetical protein